MSQQKWCNCCEQHKPVTEFSLNRRDGYQTYCKDCNRAYRQTGRFPFRVAALGTLASRQATDAFIINAA